LNYLIEAIFQTPCKIRGAQGSPQDRETQPHFQHFLYTQVCSKASMTLNIFCAIGFSPGADETNADGGEATRPLTRIFYTSVYFWEIRIKIRKKAEPTWSALA
jgi:hypothetical protein